MDSDRIFEKRVSDMYEILEKLLRFNMNNSGVRKKLNAKKLKLIRKM